MDANGLRRAYTEFFAERGHAVMPSSGLIPHHRRAPLFTNAGMNQFLPYLLGEEIPPHPRVTTVQKCVRIKGKHDDIELIGRTTRHFTFFEMLGNFSFGDYFKEGAISFAWEFVTEVLGLDGARIWVTVHDSDDDAEVIWRDLIGVRAERIQRMGADNFWEMGDTGPCGPCSEIYYDRGPDFGADGGPKFGGDERFLEFWNLVFTQYDRQPDGFLKPLPKGNIDTGAGLERILSIVQHEASAWDTDSVRPIIAAAEAATKNRYGADPETDVALRILADHGRAMTFLVNDGVFPSNEDRGYVLRRLIRRAVRQAFQLGVEEIVTPDLVHATVEVMGEAYPELRVNEEFIAGVVAREEQRFRETLQANLTRLEEALGVGDRGTGVISGELAFKLHDTYGFPIELTREIAGEKGVVVDEVGFADAMAKQRQQSTDSGKKGAGVVAHADVYRELVEQFGPTTFVGYTEEATAARVLAVLPIEAPEGAHLPHVEIFLDRTPMYAEGGGQVGDTGVIKTATGSANVGDTTYALPGLTRHTAVVVRGVITPGQEAEVAIDTDRRMAIRRNHTGTHLLHAALREVLGTHVKQAGSLVAPERLRFDFSHYGPMTAEEIARVEDIVNARVLADEAVEATEMAKTEADKLGAIAFFGDKYGDVVRVVRAGSRSTELCGGTHVAGLGQIGPVRIVSEGSIGSNLRRLEATTGTATLARLRHDEAVIGQAAQLLKANPEELVGAIERRLGELRATQDELKSVRQAGLREQARTLAAVAAADGGAVVARLDGLEQRQLQELAVGVRAEAGVRVVVLGGSPGEGKVSLVAAVAKGENLVASDLIAAAARMVGGGGGKNPELAMAGGRDPSRLDEALELVRRTLGLHP